MDPTTRRQHGREGRRYETDLTGAEWAVMSRWLRPGSAFDRRKMREIFNTIFYVAWGRCLEVRCRTSCRQSTVFG